MQVCEGIQSKLGRIHPIVDLSNFKFEFDCRIWQFWSNSFEFDLELIRNDVCFIIIRPF